MWERLFKLNIVFKKYIVFLALKFLNDLFSGNRQNEFKSLQNAVQEMKKIQSLTATSTTTTAATTSSSIMEDSNDLLKIGIKIILTFTITFIWLFEIGTL